MTCGAIPMIAFPRVRSIYIYIYIHIFLCHLHEYALYPRLSKLRYSGGLSQLMGVACNRMYGSSSTEEGKKTACSLRRNWN